MKLIILDSSQIECRVSAWLAGETWLLDAFREKRDVYCEFGKEIYHREITKKDETERFCSKTATLGLTYMMGAPKFQMALVTKSIELGLEPIYLDLSACKNIVYTYRRKNAEIVKLWGRFTDIIEDIANGVAGSYKCLSWGKDFILLPNGLKLFYPQTRVSRPEPESASHKMFKKRPSSLPPVKRFQEASYLSVGGRTKIYSGLAVENTTQALARAIVADQMRQIAQKYRIVLMEHDAIGYLAENNVAKKAFDWGLEIMSTPPKWAPDMPLAAEGICDDRNSK